MACVEGILGEKIEEIIMQGEKMIWEDDSDKAIELLEEAWDLLPDGKFEYDESFEIVEEMLEAAIKTNNKECLVKWKDRILLADPERADIGEKEMWVGRVDYVLGDFDNARAYMKVANEKSKGRCFTSEDTVYKKFYFEIN